MIDTSNEQDVLSVDNAMAEYGFYPAEVKLNPDIQSLVYKNEEKRLIAQVKDFVYVRRFERDSFRDMVIKGLKIEDVEELKWILKRMIWF